MTFEPPHFCSTKALRTFLNQSCTQQRKQLGSNCDLSPELRTDCKMQQHPHPAAPTFFSHFDTFSLKYLRFSYNKLRKQLEKWHDISGSSFSVVLQNDVWQDLFHPKDNYISANKQNKKNGRKWTELKKNKIKSWPRRNVEVYVLFHRNIKMVHQ